jgi:hypothetical protein
VEICGCLCTHFGLIWDEMRAYGQWVVSVDGGRASLRSEMGWTRTG